MRKKSFPVKSFDHKERNSKFDLLFKIYFSIVFAGIVKYNFMAIAKSLTKFKTSFP